MECGGVGGSSLVSPTGAHRWSVVYSGARGTNAPTRRRVTLLQVVGPRGELLQRWSRPETEAGLSVGFLAVLLVSYLPVLLIGVDMILIGAMALSLPHLPGPFVAWKVSRDLGQPRAGWPTVSARATGVPPHHSGWGAAKRHLGVLGITPR